MAFYKSIEYTVQTLYVPDELRAVCVCILSKLIHLSLLMSSTVSYGRMVDGAMICILLTAIQILNLSRLGNPCTHWQVSLLYTVR